MSHQDYNDNVNPFAFNTEQRGGREDTGTGFTFFADNHTITNMPTESQNRNSGVLDKLRQIKLHRWNIMCRLGTSIFCLVAIILIVISKQSKSDIPLNDGSTGKGTAAYTISGAFKFFLYVNIVVMAYALALSICAFIMGRRGHGQSTPTRLLWPVLALDLIHAGFLLLAFSAAVSVEAVARQGLVLGNILWEPICDWFKTFCFINEIALAACALGYLCLSAGTAIDAYYIYLLKND